MAARFLFVAAVALALAGAASAQTLPASPALPGFPPGSPGATGGFGSPGATGRGVQRRQPTPQGLRQNDSNTRRIQNETDELYREIMRRSAPSADSR
jgi:hypothetical protein